jgi:hypothetical protein
MKTFGIISGSIFLAAAITITALSQPSTIGYREFKLGQSLATVKEILTREYAGKNVEYLTSGDIRMVMPSDNMITVNLYFNNLKNLYKITVEIKYGDISKLKSRLVESYGQPNDFTGEEYDHGDKRYLVARWLMEKQYGILLWESFYCRNQKMIPCTDEVHYIDLRGKEIKELDDRTTREKEQEKKDKKTYDGF